MRFYNIVLALKNKFGDPQFSQDLHQLMNVLKFIDVPDTTTEALRDLNPPHEMTYHLRNTLAASMSDLVL